LKVLCFITLGFATLGLLIGIPLVISNLNLPTFENVEFDTFEHFNLSLRYFLRFVGGIGSLVAGFALVGSGLTLLRNRLGWLMLVFLYFTGICGCLYLLVQFIDLTTRYTLPLPTYPVVGLMFGIIGLSILMSKTNVTFIFRKT
jgi:hypothetical protein